MADGECLPKKLHFQLQFSESREIAEEKIGVDVSQVLQIVIDATSECLSSVRSYADLIIIF